MPKVKFFEGSYPDNNSTEKKFIDNFIKDKNFSEDWTILHSTNIHNPEKYNDKTNTEVDLLLISKKYGFIQLEIKGHGYSVEDGFWYKMDRGVKKRIPREKEPIQSLELKEKTIKDCFKTIASGKSGFGQKIRNKEIKFIPILSFIVWTQKSERDMVNSQISNANSIFLKNSKITDHKSLEEYLIEKIENFIKEKNWGSLTSDYLINELGTEFVKTAIEIFKPMQISDDIKQLSNDFNLDSDNATDEQLEIYRNSLDSSLNRHKIIGPPGSGKTLLASAIAKNIAESQNKVLFMCFNRMLSDKLKKEFSQNPFIEVKSLWSFLVEFGLMWNDSVNDDEFGVVTLEDLPPDKSADHIKDFLDTNLDKIIENTSFNTLVIDEGQDFSEKYWDFFKILVNEQENNKWFLFYDTLQALTHSEWKPPTFEANSSIIQLPIVLRCTKEISNKSQNVFDGLNLIAKYEGVDPEFIEINNGLWEEALKETVALVKKLVEVEKFHPSQITILTPHSRDEVKVKNLKYSNTKSIEGLGVGVSSVFKFKGLENDIVIFLIPNVSSLEAKYVRNPLNLVYVGISRAKFLLFLIGNKEIKNQINWNKS